MDCGWNIVIPRLKKCDMLSSEEDKILLSLFQDSSIASSYLQALVTFLWEQAPQGDREFADGEWQLHFSITEWGQLLTFVGICPCGINLHVVLMKGDHLTHLRLYTLETHKRTLRIDRKEYKMVESWLFCFYFN